MSAEKDFRDEIAVWALQLLGVERAHQVQMMSQDQFIKNTARTAYAIADAMMEARANKHPKERDHD